MAQWRFEPERDAAGPLPGHPAIGVQLRIVRNPMDAGPFPPLRTGSQRGPVQVPHADFAPLAIQVTGSRVRR